VYLGCERCPIEGMFMFCFTLGVCNLLVAYLAQQSEGGPCSADRSKRNRTLLGIFTWRESLLGGHFFKHPQSGTDDE
jgi:hypothetical protein